MAVARAGTSAAAHRARHVRSQEAGQPFEWGGDLGGADETVLSQQFDTPVFITHYPAAVKVRNLDPAMAQEIMALFRDVNARGTTVLVATHDREMIQRMGKRVITLDHGRVVAG